MLGRAACLLKGPACRQPFQPLACTGFSSAVASRAYSTDLPDHDFEKKLKHYATREPVGLPRLGLGG